MGLTRAEQKPEQIYVVVPTGQGFYTPDGEGRVWYDSLEELQEDYDGPVIFLTEEPEEN